jgi:tetratricopeptide (TPR) repeat protein
MIEPDRVLRPLQEAEPAIDQLETYESPVALSDALRATSDAVERTLRALLRSDANAPDSIRLSALSPQEMTLDAVLTELRRRDLITLGLAGRYHELRQAVERAARNEVRAADADNARDVVRCVKQEVRSLARRRADAPSPAEEPALAGHEAEWDDVAFESRADRVVRRPLYVAAAALLIVVGAIAAILLFGGGSDMEKGVQAFREDRKGVAEQHFRAALERDEDNNTARLYLARILREQGRNEEAARLLRAAVSSDPRDEGVRRELGYLFIQLNRPAAAVEQFRQAVELNATEPLNWVGLVESLRRADDPAAAEALRRAPPEAQTMIRQREAVGPGTSIP